jgi:hypothetical protein
MGGDERVDIGGAVGGTSTAPAREVAYRTSTHSAARIHPSLIIQSNSTRLQADGFADSGRGNPRNRRVGVHLKAE